MIAEERHRKILSLLEEKTAVSIAELKGSLGVNAMMLWRDLRFLEDQGLLKRVWGGAQRADIEKEASYQTKRRACMIAKTRIARAAVEHFVKEGDSIILEGGTTVSAVASLLFRRDVTIFTNSLPIAQQLHKAEAKCSVYLSGGLLRMQSGTFVGREAINFFSKRKTDVFFMSSTGLVEEVGFTDPNPQEIDVKQAMIRSAKNVVALVDSSKIGIRSLMPVTALRRVDYLISDAEEEKLAWLRGKGPKIFLV